MFKTSQNYLSQSNCTVMSSLIHHYFTQTQIISLCLHVFLQVIHYEKCDGHCFKKIVLHKVLNHRGVIAAQCRISHRSLSDFCLHLLHLHLYNNKNTLNQTSRKVTNSQAEYKKYSSILLFVLKVFYITQEFNRYRHSHTHPSSKVS